MGILTTRYVVFTFIIEMCLKVRNSVPIVILQFMLKHVSKFKYIFTLFNEFCSDLTRPCAHPKDIRVKA